MALRVPAGGDSGGFNSDLWDLTVSGNVVTTTLGIANSVALQGLVVTDIPAPDSGNTEEVNQGIISSPKDVASEISNIVITVANSSESLQTFDVTFSGSSISASSASSINPSVSI